MFVVTTVKDTIRIPPHLLPIPTMQAINNEIDQKYPNRLLMEVGLVICRYGDCVKISNGVCVAGDGGSHHECVFQLVVFRPFVEEVCVGKIEKSSKEGIQVSLGFFDDIFIPAYWMLNPSKYEEERGLWVWTPKYDEEEETVAKVKQEGESIEKEQEDRYEMELGSQIRFKVKSINFTQITKTAKGMQATTSTTAQQKSSFGTSENTEDVPQFSVRRRSSSVGLDEGQAPPATMHIVGSICEDGLGLTSWWAGAAEEDHLIKKNGGAGLL